MSKIPQSFRSMFIAFALAATVIGSLTAIAQTSFARRFSESFGPVIATVWVPVSERNLVGGFPNTVARSPRPVEDDEQAATNGKIAFERTVNGIPKIYTANPDGSDERCLMCTDALDSRQGFEPAFSPNGQTIAFVRLNEIWLMYADGSDQRRLTTPAEGFSPAWSPDGTRLAYSRSSQFGFDIWIMNADGSNRKQLTKDEVDGPSVWVTNNRIAFERLVFGDTTQRDIFIMDAADTNNDGVGDNLINITNDPANDRAPAASPDGSRIAFHSNRIPNSPKSDIYTITVTGGDLRLLTNADYDDQDPVYSPDGLQIAFESGSRPETTTNRIFLMDVNGGNQRPLVAGTMQERNPSWQASSATSATTADLAITLTDAPDPVIEQQNLTYTITVKNNGQASSRGNLRVSLLLDDFVTLRGVFVSASSGCTDTGDGLISCSSDQTLENGASLSFQVIVKYRPGRGSGRADATATITRADRVDPNTANNTTSVETTIQVAPAPANDNFNSAQTVSTASGCTSGSNVGATEESPFRGISGKREPYHAGKGAMRSVWYKWTAPNYDGNVSFDTGGSGFDTILAVYAIRTDFPDSLTEIASNNDSFNRGTSYVYFRAERDRTYYIAVTGSEKASGAINLCWTVSRQIIPGPVPQRIDAIVPAFINLDPTRGDLILQITGSGFTSDSRVLVNSQECFRPNAGAPCEINTGIQTTFRSATNLEARIPAQFLRSAGALIINVLTGSAMSDATALRILPLVVVTVPPQATASGSVTAPNGASLNTTFTNNTANAVNVTGAIYESSLLPQVPPPGIHLGGTAFSTTPLTDLGGVVAGGAGNFQVKTPLIGQDPAGLIGQDTASIMVLANSGNQLLGQDAAGIVAGGAGNIVAGGAGNLVPLSLSNMLSAKGSLINATSEAPSIGWYVVRSANGASPVVNFDQVNADGDFTVSASVSFDATSFPRTAEMASTVFVVVANPAIVQFGQTTSTISESAGVVNVTISRTGDLSVPGTLSYSTADGTATAGSDYAATSGTLTFGPGETSKTFTVAIFSDSVNEPDETFLVSLSAVANAALDNREMEVTITNAAPPAPVTIDGRVISPDGRGLRNAVVSLVDSQGVTRTAITSSLGYFSFPGLSSGHTYPIRVSSKRYRFSPRSVSPNGNLTLEDFVGLE